MVGRVWWPIRGLTIPRGAIFNQASIIPLIFQARFAGSKAGKLRIIKQERVLTIAEKGNLGHCHSEPFACHSERKRRIPVFWLRINPARNHTVLTRFLAAFSSSE